MSTKFDRESYFIGIKLLLNINRSKFCGNKMPSRPNEIKLFLHFTTFHFFLFFARLLRNFVENSLILILTRWKLLWIALIKNNGHKINRLNVSSWQSRFCWIVKKPFLLLPLWLVNYRITERKTVLDGSWAHSNKTHPIDIKW